MQGPPTNIAPRTLPPREADDSQEAKLRTIKALGAVVEAERQGKPVVPLSQLAPAEYEDQPQAPARTLAEAKARLLGNKAKPKPRPTDKVSPARIQPKEEYDEAVAMMAPKQDSQQAERDAQVAALMAHRMNKARQ